MSRPEKGTNNDDEEMWLWVLLVVATSTIMNVIVTVIVNMLVNVMIETKITT